MFEGPVPRSQRGLTACLWCDLDGIFSISPTLRIRRKVGAQKVKAPDLTIVVRSGDEIWRPAMLRAHRSIETQGKWTPDITMMYVSRGRRTTKIFRRCCDRKLSGDRKVKFLTRRCSEIALVVSSGGGFKWLAMVRQMSCRKVGGDSQNFPDAAKICLP